jgi:aspartyl aminopeptidase
VKRLAESGISEEDVIDYSLHLSDAQPPQIVGADRALVCGPGLDWLVGAYAAVQAFLKGEGGTAVLIVAEDLGAGWIGETLDRVFGADLGRILAKSVYVNVQAVDARPPVWRNCPRTIGIGQGVAILTAPSRSGTDLGTREIVNHAGQKICVRTRLVSEKVEGEKTLGLTGGAVVGAKLGVAAVDIGVPVLGSGSARLTAAVADVEAATRLLTELSENIDEHKQALY